MMLTRRRWLGAALAGTGSLGFATAGWTRALQAGAVVGVSPYGPLGSADSNGIRLPAGFTSRLLATSGQVVAGTSYTCHLAPDGGATFPSAGGGWVYVSNAELYKGGVGALRFAADGSVAGIAGVLQPFDHGGHAPDEYRRLTPVLEHVVAHYRRRLAVGDLARRAGLSPSQLQREFRRLFNMTVGDYVLRLRLLMARKRLRSTTDVVGRIATDCGFYDQAHFTRAFKQHTGQTPLEYRRSRTRE